MLKLLVALLLVGGGLGHTIAVRANLEPSIAPDLSNIERSLFEITQTEMAQFETAQTEIAPADHATAMLMLINQERQRQGLSPLELSTSLSTAAQSHAEDMAAHNYFSHRGRNGSSISDRAGQVGYAFRALGENIAAGNTTANAVFEQWMNSDGHRRNMMSPNFTEMGLGAVLNAPNTDYSHYWVLVLGDR